MPCCRISPNILNQPIKCFFDLLDLALVIGPTGTCNGSFNSACWFSSFVPKCYTALIFALKRPCGHWMYCIWTKTQYLNVSTQKYRITVPKVSLDLVYTITLLFTQNFFLTCFDFKISHLGSNDYPRLVLDPKWNFGLHLKHNNSKQFGKPKVPIFVPRCYTTLIFAQKGSYGHRKDCIWTKTQCLNVLTQKYRISVPKVIWTAGMESLEPTISLKTHPRKPRSRQWMENLDPLRARFKNLDYIKIKTRWRTYLKNPDYKEERHKGCDLPSISSKVQSRIRGVNSTHNEKSIYCLPSI